MSDFLKQFSGDDYSPDLGAGAAKKLEESPRHAPKDVAEKKSKPAAMYSDRHRQHKWVLRLPCCADLVPVSHLAD